MSHRGCRIIGLFSPFLLAFGLTFLSAATASATGTHHGGGLGSPCSRASQCNSGFCVDGVCCNSACNAGCGACNVYGHKGTCKPEPKNTVCRPSCGSCDVTETCTGSSTACPADAKKPSGTVCRAAAGSCDVAETCSGASDTCPSDAKKPSGTVCRVAAGGCDVAETCSGASSFCPSDAKKPSGTVCRDAAGTCDIAETCSGSSSSCPGDAKKPSGIVCRDSAGTCDVAETCSGASATCPSDSFLPPATVCRASAGTCDVAETCSGASPACPADAFASSSTICRESGGVCDVAETCSGSSPACPADAFASASTTCRAAAGTCDVAETCSGSSATCPADAFASASTTCRAAAGVCDIAETCSGSSATCPANAFAPSSTVCRESGGVCDVAETCSGSSADCPVNIFAASSTTCRASAGACDAAEICSGSSADCPADTFASAGTTCRAAGGDCDVAESCSGSSADCPADALSASGTTCRASAGACDVAETCSGSSAVCPADVLAASGATCRAAAGDCDVAEACSGSSADCPADALASSGTTCRAAAGACDAAETCTGATATCPADSFASAGTTCRAAGGDCDVAEACSGSSADCPADILAASGTTCRAAAGDCDVPEACSGSSAVCPADALASSGTTCRAAAGDCDVPEACSGSSAACPADAFAASDTTCRASAGDCDVAEACSGSSAACPGDALASAGTTCRAATGACDAAETCTGATATCPADVFASAGTTCRASGGDCDVAEACTGSSADCPADIFVSSSTTCRASAGDCDVAETCTGSSAICPSDAFASNLTTCRASAGPCDAAEACTGSSVTCPDDALAPSTTICRAVAGACDAAETCTGSSTTCPADLSAPAGTPCGTNGMCNGQGECGAANDAPVVNAGADQTIDLEVGRPPGNFTLQRISTNFNNPVGIEYHPILNKMVTSVNCCNGQPNNFDFINADGSHGQYTNINGIGDELYFAIARDEGGGFSRGGFRAGEMLTGVQQPGVIARVSPDGTTIQNPWVVLPGEPGIFRGMLYLDRTGLYNGDLIATTTAANLWRVTSTGEATKLASLASFGVDEIEGLTTVPNDPLRYGPWAGKILVGDEHVDKVIAVDADGQITTYQIGMHPENIMVVPPGENFYGVDYFGGAIWGASASQFRDMVGDIIIAEEHSGEMYHVSWDGIRFNTRLMAKVTLWEHTTFGPPPMAEITDSVVRVSLNGTATDDGRPPGSTLSVIWSVVSGPGPVTFADSRALSTTASFIEPGTYVLRLTASDGSLTTTDDVTVTVRRVTPHNNAPTVNAGPDQTLTIPDVVVLTGSAADDGLPFGSAISLSWTQVSGPAPAVINNPHLGLTTALVVEAGTYVFRLTASDGEVTTDDDVTITVNPERQLVGGTLMLTLSDPGPMPLGAGEFVTAVLLDASATPVPRFPIIFTLTGANPGTATFVTDDMGVAILPYTGRYPGTDSIFATAMGFTQSLTSATVSVAWIDVPIGAPLLTQGWIKSPVHQSTIMEPTRIELSDNITLTDGTLRYWPWSHPSDVHTLATGLSGAPGATLANFDTTVLSNGSYVIDLTGTDNTGRVRQSEVLIIVDGEYKPGRVVVELKDFEVPLAGLPITIGRRYDSLEKDLVGDFGHGWSLAIGHPKLEADLANNVSITMPNGRRTTFYFTGQHPVIGPVTVGFWLLSGYTPAPGTFGTLTSDGCPVLALNPFTDDPPTCFAAMSPTELLYRPTQYTYTDPNGTVYIMGATGELRSITDRQGNSLTFTRNGIVSSTGHSVTFTRDALGRITHVDYPAFFRGEDNAARYDYDAAGDLVTVNLAKVPWVFFRTMFHTYDSAHRLRTSTDPNGNTVRVSTYDADGRLETDTDALGNLVRYAYNVATRTNTTTFPDTGVMTTTFDAHGSVLRETDQRGKTTTHEYSANHQETRTVNALGEVRTATYDGFGNMTSNTDPSGTMIMEYGASSRLAAVRDRLGHRMTLDYDASGTMKSLADQNGTRLTFTNSERGLPLTVADAEGKVASLEHDAAGNTTKRTDWLGRVTRATYDEAGHQLTATSARGGTTTNTYHLSGNLAFTRDAMGYERTFSYDPNGNLVGESDNVGRQTVSAYNALSQLIRVTRSPGTVVSYTRNFRGDPLTMTDENDRTTRYEYDLAGNLTKTTFPDGTFTTRTYDALNRLASLTDERGNTTTYQYEAGCGCSDRVTRVTDPLGRSTVTAYDANGRKSSVTDAEGHTTIYAYNSRGQLVETSYPDGRATRDEYDPRGRRSSTTDQTGAATLYAYDDQGQLTSVTDPLGNVTRYLYDPDGNVTSFTDANNHVTRYDYDLMNRKTKRTLPVGQFETFAFDLAGRQIGHMDFRGKTTMMAYDLRDRMLTKTPDPSLGEPSHTYTYSPTGRRLSSTDASGATTYAYDLRDRLLSKATAAGTVTYAYDPAGNVASIRSSNTNGTSIDYSWDAANQLTSITDNRAGGTTTATYTATRRPFTLALPNGVGASYSYDSMDRVTSMHWRQGASPEIGRWDYTYNERGQRLSATDITGRRTDYGYDIASRLVSEIISGAGPSGDGAITYVLDAFANRLTRTSGVNAVPSASYSYDANDQLTTDGHDANGNTTSSAGHTYAYDFENRLVSKDGAAVTLQYNCDGDRVAKTAGGVTTQYLVDDLNPTGYLQVLEEVVGGAVQTRYAYGTGLISQTRSVSATPATSYYGYDGHGSITFLTDTAGSVTDSYDYDGAGILLRQSGSTPNTRLYAGEEFDPDLGLINLRARQYSPSTGRFFTLDPLDLATSAGRRDRRVANMIASVANPQLRAALEVGIPDRSSLSPAVGNPILWNRFLYANGDPVNLVDPSGRVEAATYAALIFWAANLVFTWQNTFNINSSVAAKKCGIALGPGVMGLLMVFLPPAGWFLGLLGLFLQLLCIMEFPL